MARIYKLIGPASNKKANPVKETKDAGSGDKPSDIKKLNTEQLRSRAAELGIDISGCKNNSERADTIIAALERSKTDHPAPPPAGSGGQAGGSESGTTAAADSAAQ